MAQNEAVEPLEPLSARALGSYMYMLHKETYVTAEELSEVFKEGRDAFRAAIKELRSYGLVTTRKLRLSNGKMVTESKLVLPPEAGNQALETRPLLQQNLYIAISNIYNRRITNSSSSKQLYSWKNMSAGADNKLYNVLNIPLGGEMSTDYDDYLEDQEANRKLWDQERQEEFESKKRATHKKDLAKGSKNVHGCVAEFASRVEKLWRVAPWEQSKKDFIIAYANARRNYKTTGDMEIKMMDLFFNSKEYVSEISDPNHMWRKFISMFGPLSSQVKNTLLSSDKVEREEIRKAKSLEKLFDV